MIWLTVGLAAIPSVALWAWIGRRLGNQTSITLACIMEAVGVAANVLFDSAADVLASSALLGGTFIGIPAVGMTTARELALSSNEGGDPRRMLGLIVAAFGAGQMIGPAYVGYVAEITGSFTIPSLAASAALLLAAVLAMLVRVDFVSGNSRKR